MERSIELSDVLRNKAVSVGAAHWVDELREIVESLEDDWGIEVGPQFDEGTEAFVAEARSADGTAAILKVLIPRGPGLAQP